MESTSESQLSGDEGAAQGAPGKSRERLEISSGVVIVIDQFMLGNKQFLDKVAAIGDVEKKDELAGVCLMYGGCILSMQAGTYYVYRDPQQNLIVLAPAGTQASEEAEEFDFEPIINAKGNLLPAYHVFVDTRCLVFMDAASLFDPTVVEEYCSLRAKGQDKQGRDLLREKGAAVRYGFNRYGDELGVFELRDERLIALWPDISSSY